MIALLPVTRMASYIVSTRQLSATAHHGDSPVTTSGFSTGTEPNLILSKVDIPSQADLPNVDRRFSRFQELGQVLWRGVRSCIFKEVKPGYICSISVSHDKGHIPICSFQSFGIGRRLSLQQYVQGIFSISSTPAPCELVNFSSPSIFFRKELMTGPRPCHILSYQLAH
jgi:hypothetical protein